MRIHRGIDHKKAGVASGNLSASAYKQNYFEDILLPQSNSACQQAVLFDSVVRLSGWCLASSSFVIIIVKRDRLHTGCQIHVFHSCLRLYRPFVYLKWMQGYFRLACDYLRKTALNTKGYWNIKRALWVFRHFLGIISDDNSP